jgi:hypothetical protein
MSKTPVGEVRPSQLMWTYGPGALVDLPNLSVVTTGIDRWDIGRCQPILEARLLENVRHVLGDQVESLRMPPLTERDGVDPFSAEALIGVPVRPFPRWMRCVKCQLLSPFDAGLFQFKENRFRPEKSRFVHGGCTGWRGDQAPRDADAVPARHLLACPRGHLDDFPWHWFVHAGASACTGTLRFVERGAALQTENLFVFCDGCDAAKPMVEAFGEKSKDRLPGCRGRHPHIDRFDPNCKEMPRTVLLGASNGWFPVSISALAIPNAGSPLAQLIADGWSYFEDVESAVEAAAVVKTLKKSAQLPGIERFSGDQVFVAIQARRNSTAEDDDVDLKGPEWDVFTAASPPSDFPHFMSKPAEVPDTLVPYVSRVLLLERLREVNALIGFTRIEAPEGLGESERTPRAPIGRSAPTWVPATQVHGEGIFIQFHETALVEWAAGTGARALGAILRRGHRGWRARRGLEPDADFPGVRFALLHTIAHLLIRELALDCGYSAASIRERIYADVDGPRPQAGILIYTAAADSDGTLGGTRGTRDQGEPWSSRRPSTRTGQGMRI